MADVRVELPYHLRTLARIQGDLAIVVEAPVTQARLVAAIETRFPMLRGTIYDHQLRRRRPYLRFYANEQDLSHEPPDAPLPDSVVSGREPFLVVGAMSGGDESSAPRFRRASRLARLAAVLGVAWLGSCARDDRVPAALRDRLAAETRLSDEELTRVRLEAGRRVGERTVRIHEGAVSRPLDAAERAGVLEVLTLPAGVFDEGVRRDGGATYRVLNGPARSTHQEIEASQRLWLDVETLLPRRYEFAYAFPGAGEDRAYDLTVDPPR